MLDGGTARGWMDRRTYVRMYIVHEHTHQNTYSVWKQRSANAASYPDTQPLLPDMVSAYIKVKQNNVESGPMNERKKR